MKICITNIAINLLLFSSSTSHAQTRTTILDYEKIRCTYDLVNGRLSGNYISYYNNGIKKSEGKLQNGYRTGTWVVWDSTGRKRMERIYKNPFEFKRVFPAIPNDGPIPLLAENAYKVTYNADGIIEYAYMKVEDAIWRHKYWRYLEPVNNDILFKDNRILKIIFELIRSANVTAFDIVDDRFTTPLKKDSALSLSDHDNIELIGLNLKEESIFDMGRLVFEHRIIGFCPVVKIDARERELFWIYYPAIRKFLGRENITGPVIPKIKTLDDLFIFRHFSSSIIKTTVDNPYDYYLKDYRGMTAAGLKKEQEVAELTIIEAENNMWISLTK